MSGYALATWTQAQRYCSAWQRKKVVMALCGHKYTNTRAQIAKKKKETQCNFHKFSSNADVTKGKQVSNEKNSIVLPPRTIQYYNLPYTSMNTHIGLPESTANGAHEYYLFASFFLRVVDANR